MKLSEFIDELFEIIAIPLAIIGFWAMLRILGLCFAKGVIM